MTNFLLILTAATIVAASQQHSAQFKSLCSVDYECSSVSQGPDCVARCRGLVTRFWNDTTGLPDVTIYRYYNARSCSYCHGGVSTDQCLHDLDVGESCRRAEFAVNCYDQRVNRSELKFVPFTNIEQLEIFQKCVDIMQLSQEVVSDLACNGILSHPEGRCLFRCFMIRSGLYSDTEGPALDRINVQCVSGYGQEVDLRNAETCLAKLRAECGSDKCSLASRAAVECMQVGLSMTPACTEFVPYCVDFLRVTKAAVVRTYLYGYPY